MRFRRISFTGLALAISTLMAACGGAAAPAPSSAAPSAAAPAASAKPSAAAASPAASSAVASPKPSAAASAKPAASAAGTRKVRYAIATMPPTVDTVGVYFALDNGFYKEEGLDVDVQGFVGGVTAVRALLSREVEFSTSSADTAYLANMNGAPIKVVMSTVTRDLNEIVAAKSVASLKDAAGKRWGISAPNSQGHVLARILLQKNGVDASKVEFVAIGSPPDRVKALIAGRIDITTMITSDQQVILDAIQKGDFKLLGAVADVAPELPDQYEITRDDLIKDQPDTVARMVKAGLRGYRWAQQNPDKAAQLASKYIKEAPPEQIARSIKAIADMKVWGVDGGITAEGIDQAQKLYQQFGVIPRTVKAEEVANTKFVEQAVKELGPFKP